MQLESEKGAAGSTARPLKADQHGGLIDPICTPLIPDPQAQPVYLHGRLIGFVIEVRCGGYDAVSIRTGALGRFNSESAAACAILADLAGARHGFD